MKPIVLSVSDETIWSITLEPSSTILEASSSIIHDFYSTVITYDNHQLMIINDACTIKVLHLSLSLS